MLLILLAYLGGILTILSPCILPVLPFVFARADRPFVRSTLPMLAGMAATFAIVATLAAVGGGWAVRANAIGRWAALALLAMFGIALVFPSVSDRLTRPLVALGSRLTEKEGQQDSVWSSVILGVATGLLWAPCAGPILGIIFTAAALQGASFNTTLLLLAYALGAATSLALALLVGGKLFARMKKSLGASERIRQVLGVLVLVGVAAIAFGFDTKVLSKISSAQTASIESGLARNLGASQSMDQSSTRTNAAGELVLPVLGTLPPLDGIGPWFNSPPLTNAATQGQGRADRLLDLQLHQLPSNASLFEGVGLEVSQGWARHHRNPRTRIRIRARACERRQGYPGSGGSLPRRARQRICAVERAAQPILAGALLRRCAGPHSLCPSWRRRVCDVGTRDPAASRRSRPRPRGRHVTGERERRRGGSGIRRDRLARDLYRLLSRRAFRLAGRPRSRQAEDLCAILACAE